MTTVGAVITICSSFFISAVAAVWTISNRFARVEAKLDAHLMYHKGYERFGSYPRMERE